MIYRLATIAVGCIVQVQPQHTAKNRTVKIFTSSRIVVRCWCG